MRFWLMKSEPDEVSIDDVRNAPSRTVPGLAYAITRRAIHARRYAGRDRVLFYHSSCAEPGIAGIVEVVSTAYPDATQFDPRSKYFDPKSDRGNSALDQRRCQIRRKATLIPLSYSPYVS